MLRGSRAERSQPIDAQVAMLCIAALIAAGAVSLRPIVNASAGDCAYYGQPYLTPGFSSRSTSDWVTQAPHRHTGWAKSIPNLVGVQSAIKVMNPWVEPNQPSRDAVSAWVMLVGGGLYAQVGWLQYEYQLQSYRFLEWATPLTNPPFHREVDIGLNAGDTHTFKVTYVAPSGPFEFWYDGAVYARSSGINFTPDNAQIYTETWTRQTQFAGDTSQPEQFTQSYLWAPNQINFQGTSNNAEPQWSGVWDDGQTTAMTADFACGAQTAFNWYDSASPAFSSDDFHILNAIGSGSNVSAALPARSAGQGGLPWCPACYLYSGTRASGNFANQAGGPLRVGSSAGYLLASQRVIYNQSFSEVNGVQNRLASNRLYFNWYDNTGPFTTDNIHISNLGGAITSGTIEMLGPTYRSMNFSVSGASGMNYSFPAGSVGGPIVINVTNGGPAVLASQRVLTGGFGFNELNALTSFYGSTTANFPWYDNRASFGFAADAIHVTNVGSSATTITVSGAGQSCQLGSIAPNQTTYCSFPANTLGGPITVSTSPSGQIIATQRVLYNNSFSEVPGMTSLAATHYFSWYDRASSGFSGDDIMITNPNLEWVAGRVVIPGYPAQTFFVDPGKTAAVSFPIGTIGGPITVQVTSPSYSAIYASKRTTYYSSFHEVNDLSDP